jgi:endonuclease YncB( thermonuclease family)
MFLDPRLLSGGSGGFALCAFVLGLALGPALVPALPGGAQVERNALVPRSANAAGASAAVRPGYPAEVLRVHDGDTFEARVHLWPGLDITTRVRLRGIDAAEMRARCIEERDKAEAARAALSAILDQGEVAIARVALDKYGGRVVADASTRTTPDVARALLDAGVVRRYDGGRRAPWC